MTLPLGLLLHRSLIIVASWPTLVGPGFVPPGGSPVRTFAAAKQGSSAAGGTIGLVGAFHLGASAPNPSRASRGARAATVFCNRRQNFLPAALALLGAWLAFPGCRTASELPRWRACQCEYVTDFDQPGRHDVQVCAAGDDAPSVAQICLRNEGVGAVGTCRCGAPVQPDPCAFDKTPCRPGSPDQERSPAP